MPEPDTDSSTRRAFSAYALLHAHFHPQCSMGGGSKSGAVLSRVLLYSARTRPCALCAKRSKELEAWLARAEQWDNRPSPSLELLLPDRRPYAELFPPPSQGDCVRCGGTGFVFGNQRAKPLTVRPTGSSRHGSVPRLPPSYALAAESSTVMRRVGRANPLHRDALTAYHGPAGDYADTNCGSRLLAVVTLTSVYRNVIWNLIHAAPEPTKKPKKGKKKKYAADVARETPPAPWCRRVVPHDAEELTEQQQRLVTQREESLAAYRAKTLTLTDGTVIRAAEKSAIPKPPEDTRSLGEAMLMALKEWRTSPITERVALWEAAELEAQALLDAAMATWSECCDA